MLIKQTVRLHLATCFGRKRPSSGQLRTILRYSKNSTQWDPILFTLKVDKIWKFLFKIKTVEYFGKMVQLNVQVLYWGLTVVYILIVLSVLQITRSLVRFQLVSVDFSLT